MNSGVEFGKSHLIPTIRSELMSFKIEMKLSKERFQNKATVSLKAERDYHWH